MDQPEEKAKPKYDTPEHAPKLNARRGLFEHGDPEQHCFRCGLLLAACKGKHIEAILEEDHWINGIHFAKGRPIFVPKSKEMEWSMSFVADCLDEVK